MTPTNNVVDVAVYQKAKKGNYYCGDSYIYQEIEDGFICAIADGLGSGEYALESSDIAINIIRNNPNVTVEDLVVQCNKELYGKRGVVLGILKLDFSSQTYSFSSIGNIGVLIITDGKTKKRNIPNGGYLAGYKRTFKVVQEKLLPNMNFILFSDGVTDEELSKCFLYERDVNKVISAFKNQCATERKDDTTLLAISYNT